MAAKGWRGFLPTNSGPGKAVFVPFVLPGESVEAALREEKPGFARARLEGILTASRSTHRSAMSLLPALWRMPLSAHRLRTSA